MKEFRVIAGNSAASTKVFVDGKQISNCTSIKFTATARGLCKVTLEVLPASLEIEDKDGFTKLFVKEKKLRK